MDPAAPREVGLHKFGEPVRGVEASGGYVWVYGYEEVRVIDLADPDPANGMDAFRTTEKDEIFRGLVVGEQFACALYGTDWDTYPCLPDRPRPTAD